MITFLVFSLLSTFTFGRGLTIVAVSSYLRLNFQSVSHYLAYNIHNSSRLTAAIGNTTSALGATRNVGKIPHSYSIPVLLYHGITEESDRFSLTLETFKDQMFAMKRDGHETITLKELEDFMGGRGELPRKSFLLTFDDGRIDSYVQADPLLKALDYTAVMFVATDASLPPPERKKSTYYISADDIEDMIGSKRWEIGSHAIQDTKGYVIVAPDGTKGNFLSNRAWIEGEFRLENDLEYENRIKHELVDSQKLLEEKFDIEVNTFSYPFGDYGNQTVNNNNATNTVEKIVRENYKLAFRQTWPNDGEFTSNYPDAETNLLKRIETPTDWSGNDLVEFLEKSQDKELPFIDNFSKDNGWKRTWGVFEVTGEDFVLKATASTTGAAVFLDGTKVWQDYIYMSTLDWQKGSHVSLVARYKDSQNYNVCIFSDDIVKIESVIDGKIKKLAEEKNFLDMPKEDVSLGVLVRGDFMECLIGKSAITFATINSEDGGIGVKIWDKELDNAEIKIKEVLIDEAVNANSVLSELKKYKNKNVK